MPLTRLGQVLCSAATGITVEITDPRAFEENKRALQVGRYLRIAEGNHDFIVAVIRNVRAFQGELAGEVAWRFEIECAPVGRLIAGKKFQRGSTLLPVPMEPVGVLDEATLHAIFESSEEADFELGKVAINQEVPFRVAGDRFFGKHIAVVGSTGSGKSCAVTKILHEAIGISNGVNLHAAHQRNSHVVIFDIHSEYQAAFDLGADQNFTLNALSIDNLVLPYWLMNSEELEALFIERGENNHHNQSSQFRRAVVLNKERHNPDMREMTYDTPAYFSMREVINYIENLNREIVGRLEGENAPKLADGSIVRERESRYFDAILDFAESSTAKDKKATNGAFAGEFTKFLSRLENKFSDRRLAFLLRPCRKDGSEFRTADFEDILRQLIGYVDKANVTVVDLSGVPFEVLSVTVSLMARMLFDFAFHYSKLCHASGRENDIPLLLVCEEAHNYVPANDASAYRASRQSIERIAKEGRKYGLSLMVVSQRPSEVSATIFAQCSNFVAMRLTNADDQAYVRHLFPDTSAGLTEVLPALASGECVVVGDAVLLPAVVKLSKPIPEPRSSAPRFLTEWRGPWKDIELRGLVSRWRRE